jgi:O-antigen/teichoic acid export membrane protein
MAQEDRIPVSILSTPPTMQKRRVLINAITSLVQVVIVAGVLFFLYRFLLQTIGVKQLGIWSLILATTSVTQIANFGLSGSVVKFVAKYAARGEDRNVSEVIQTAVISLGVIVGYVLFIGYPLIKYVLGLVIPQGSLQLVFHILPFAIFSLWLTTITSVYLSGLDGLHRIYIRNILMIGSSVFYAFLCFILATKCGLIGLAYAQIINNLLILITSLILIKRFLPAFPIIPYQWNNGLFKEIIFYGFNFQIIAVTQMCYDPVTKILLSKFGGLSMVGYYEMANKMVQQFRALIVSANQALVPFIADLQEKNSKRIRSVYLSSYNLLFYLALPTYTLVIISTPLISEIWIGHYERIFVIFGILLSIGWFLNTLAGPSYFANFGTGILRWNVIGHIAIGILDVGLGIIFGLFFNGFGVAIAWVIALSLGSVVICVAYHLTNEIPLNELFPSDSRAMFFCCTIILVISLAIQHRLNYIVKAVAMNNFITSFLFLLILISFWFHPMRKRLAVWANELFTNRNVS